MPKPMISKATTELEIIEPTSIFATNPNPDSLVASAVQVRPGDNLWNTYRFTNSTWQQQAWRFYHAIPELHFAADYIGAACSRVRIFIEKLDKYRRRAGEVTDDDTIAAVAETLFGGPAAKAQALRMIGINLTIAGECYIIGRSRRDFTEDRWFVASTTELKRRAGQITINFGYGPEQILAGSDLIMRLWNPDAERMQFADSPTLACFAVLQELEELMLYEFSQIDSRLSGAGMYPLPAEMSNGPSDASSAPQSADDVFNMVALAGKAARSGRGVAAGTTPLFFEVPGEYLKDLKDSPIRFDSELSDKLEQYKKGAISRLATGMNMPAEVLTGMGDVNHISVWSIEESFVKIHIEPMMNLICDGLTKAYLRPLLRAMGKNPDEYQISFDTAPLTVRASRLQDTINLYNLDIVSAEEVLLAGNYNPLTARPSDEEQTKRFVRELMLRDPTLVAVPALVEAADLDIDMPDPAALMAPGQVPGDPNAPGPPPPPAPEPSTDNQRRPVDPRSTDSGPTRPRVNAGSGGTPILASGQVVEAPNAVLAAANVVVRRALELAGGQLLTREHRGRFPDVAKHDLHTKIKVDAIKAQEVLSRAFDFAAQDFAALDVNVDELAGKLHAYCMGRLVWSQPHDIEALRRELW